VDVIGLAIEFEQAPTLPGATLRGHLANPGEHGRVNGRQLRWRPAFWAR